jgi:hypothetical protein
LFVLGWVFEPDKLIAPIAGLEHPTQHEQPMTTQLRTHPV